MAFKKWHLSICWVPWAVQFFFLPLISFFFMWFLHMRIDWLIFSVIPLHSLKRNTICAATHASHGVQSHGGNGWMAKGTQVISLGWAFRISVLNEVLWWAVFFFFGHYSMFWYRSVVTKLMRYFWAQALATDVVLEGWLPVDLWHHFGWPLLTIMFRLWFTFPILSYPHHPFVLSPFASVSSLFHQRKGWTDRCTRLV